MRFKRKMAALWVLVIVLLCSIYGYADEVHGSIEIKMMKDGVPVAGGSIILYQVAQWEENQYRVTNGFLDFGSGKLDWKQPETAKSLFTFAEQQGIDGEEQIVTESGTVLFSDLAKGCYLVAQRIPAEGYLPIRPFVITIPTSVEQSEMYHVTAYPKCMEKIQGESPQTGQSPLPYYLFFLSGSGILCMLLLLCTDQAVRKHGKG